VPEIPSPAGGVPSTARHPDKAGGHGGALASAVIRKDLAEMCRSNPCPYFTGSTLTQHAKESHSIKGLFALSIPRPVISRPAARDEPAGCWSAPGGPLEPFASVTVT